MAHTIDFATMSLEKIREFVNKMLRAIDVITDRSHRSAWKARSACVAATALGADVAANAAKEAYDTYRATWAAWDTARTTSRAAYSAARASDAAAIDAARAAASTIYAASHAAASECGMGAEWAAELKQQD